MKRATPILLVLIAVLAGGAVGLAAATLAPRSGPSPTGTGIAVAGGTPPPTAAPGTPGPSVEPTPSPSPTPAPTPTLVPAPLDGVLVPAEVAARHPIAVMIDDLNAARPQSGLNAASVVWQAPAEGGIPRYMLLFQENIPGLVGPVRSSRYYFIAWASEVRAMYVHAGGSPQALSTLRAKGSGQYVYNADDFRYEGRYLWRIKTRFAPHNLYTDGAHLRKLATVVHATDGPITGAWTFAPDAALADRPTGGRIDVSYPYNKIRYDYDRNTNTYLRRVTGFLRQIDAADKKQVAPKNVVIMFVSFGPLNDGHPNKKRLEANLIGKGAAWIATNGKTIKGTWRKQSVTAPTLFFDSLGHPVTLTVGQTFVQVLQTGSKILIKDGVAPAAQ
ncbi:MAG TPA: DUF3048 domain-containing protein [Candidatus Limnocylindrales bacterium]